MQVEFRNLGCFPKFEYSFPENGLGSLVARSGTGKSTFLNCIFWIWTGKPKNDMVYRGAKTKDPAWGRFTSATISIYRQQKPSKKLEVTLDNMVLEDKAAKAYLNQRYGTEELMLASAYSRQEKYHPLLRESAADRLSLMQTLVMTSQKPSEYIEKVTTRLRDVTTVLTKLDHKIKVLEKELEGLSEEDFLEMTEDADSISNELTEVRQFLIEQEEKISIFHRRSGELKVLRASLEKVQKSIDKPFEDATDLLERITLQKQKQKDLLLEQERAIAYLAMSKIVSRAMKLMTEIEGLPQLELPLNLKTIRQQEAKYETATKLMKSLNLEYTEEARKKMITELTLASEYYKWEPSVVKLKKLESEVGESPKYEREQLEKWSRELELHHCPACEAGLRFQNGKLILESTGKIKVPLTAKEIEEQKKYILDYTKRLENIKVLQETIPYSAIKEPNKPTWTKTQVGKLNELKSVECIAPPEIPSSQVELALRRVQLEEELAALEYTQLPEERDPSLIAKDLKKVGETIKTLENLQVLEKQKAELQRKINALEEELSSHSFLDSEIQEKRERRDQLEKLFARWHLLTEKRKLWEKRDEKRQKQKRLQREQVKGLRIKEVMVSKEYQMLDEVTERLNKTLNVQLKRLFEKPIEVNIRGFKEAKSTGNKKSQITLEYRIDTSITDKPDSYVSIGEQHRISIGLYIAFAKMSELPILFFDEEIASQNSVFCDAIRECLARALPEKLIVMAHHNDTGDYDFEINLEDEIGKF